MKHSIIHIITNRFWIMDFLWTQHVKHHHQDEQRLLLSMSLTLQPLSPPPFITTITTTTSIITSTYYYYYHHYLHICYHHHQTTTTTTPTNIIAVTTIIGNLFINWYFFLEGIGDRRYFFFLLASLGAQIVYCICRTSIVTQKLSELILMVFLSYYSYTLIKRRRRKEREKRSTISHQPIQNQPVPQWNNISSLTKKYV